MGYSAKWKVLEDLILELRKKGFETPPNVIYDLRSAKSMIKITETEGGKGDTTLKLEEILGNVESELINDSQNVLSAQETDEWLKRLNEATLSTCEAKSEAKSTLVTGVPRDQKWIRVEPMPNLPAVKLTQIAKENTLSVLKQNDGRLVVYGKQESIKAFLRRMTEEA
jgi:hypothetical protein